MDVKFEKALRTWCAISLVSAISAGSTGCFGSFIAVRKVWEFNKEIHDNKFVQWAVFLGLVIIPVYALFSLGDALIFNSVEFWGGSNPLAGGPDGSPNTRVVQISDETTLRLERDPESGAMIATILEDGAVIGSRRFTPVADGMVVTDEHGARLAAVRKTADGGVEVFGADDRPLTMISMMEADALGRAYERGGAGELARLVTAGAGLSCADAVRR